MQFKKLDIEDKQRIEKFAGKYLPFSDFTFLSLFSYNTNGTVEYCFLNQNLVIKFEDYITGENFYSILGEHQITETVHELMEQARSEGINYSLNLVPHSVLEAEPGLHQVFHVEEDRDNFDYIVSSLDIAELAPEKFPRKRKLVENFKKDNPHLAVKPIDLSDPKNRKAILQTFDDWRVSNKKDVVDAELELGAVKRLLDHAHHFPDLYALGIYDGDKLVAFNTYEISTHSHGISSFQKADRRYKGIYAFLTHEMAKSMSELGCEYINFEQDLGINGLRSSKTSWHPVNYLKKYSIHPAKP